LKPPDIKLVQVIHVHDHSSVEEAKAVADVVDALLLDSGNQALEIKDLGGTARTHDWALSREICEVAGIPVFLAGGLNHNNIADAISLV
jgi:phosphoribosylanthranilate isomerase